MTVPKVGDIIYVDSECYLSHRRDDFAGGKATVTRVSFSFVAIKESPDSSYNWEFLEPEQERLKRELGDQWAHPEPDLRPGFNEDFFS
jgi:hypothetical protein